MSNKIVPQLYRSVIDEVMAAIKPEFDEYGVGEDVLADLQHKWQQKVMASGVAEFEPAPPPVHHPPPPHHTYPPHPLHMLPHYAGTHNPYAPPPVPGQPAVKTEPIDSRYALLPGMPQYTLAGLTGPTLAGPPRPGAPAGAVGVMSFPAARPPAIAAHMSRPTSATPLQPTATAQPRIPQVDGPSSSGSDGSPEPAYAPHTSHPSLPQPSQTSTTAADDPEAINSDLDDSDEDDADDEEAAGAMTKDLVFCTYDKVARVRNKWKCVLKDGMIHVNNKDYLFAKCTGEFEW